MLFLTWQWYSLTHSALYKTFCFHNDRTSTCIFTSSYICARNKKRMRICVTVLLLIETMLFLFVVRNNILDFTRNVCWNINYYKNINFMTLTQIRAPNITHLIYLNLKHIFLNFYARTQKLMKLNNSECNCRIYSSRSVLYLRSFNLNLIV